MYGNENLVSKIGNINLHIIWSYSIFYCISWHILVLRISSSHKKILVKKPSYLQVHCKMHLRLYRAICRLNVRSLILHNS